MSAFFTTYTVVRVPLEGDERVRLFERLRQYLYGHTQISENLSEPGAVVLVTTSEKSQDNADYLADYQAQRLQSGLFSVSSCFDTEAAVSEHAIEIAVQAHERWFAANTAKPFPADTRSRTSPHGDPVR